MALSGPQKAGRRSIWGLDSLARRREENERLEVVWVAGWTRALRRDVPRRRRCAICRFQSVLEVVWGWDAFLQACVLPRVPHSLAGAAGVVEGVCEQGLEVPGRGRPGRSCEPSSRP